MRAFRITFDESTSKFVIEIQGFAGMYWKKAKVTEFRGEKDEFRVTKSFDTYQKARDYVKDIGLDQVYEDFTLQKPYGSPSTYSGIAGVRPVVPGSLFTAHEYGKVVGKPAEQGTIFWTQPHKDQAA